MESKISIFFFFKKLYKEASKKIKQLKELAIEYGEAYYVPILYEKEALLESGVYNFSSYDKSEDLDSYFDGYKSSLEILSNSVYHQIIGCQFAFFRTKNNDREIIRYLETPEVKKVLSIEEAKLTIKTKITRRLTQVAIAYSNNDISRIFQTVEIALQDYDENKSYRNKNYISYLAWLQLAINTGTHYGQWDKIDFFLQKYQELKEEADKLLGKDELIKGTSHSNNFELMISSVKIFFFLRSGHFKDNIKEVNQIALSLSSLKTEPIVYVDMTQYRIAVIYFGAKLYDKSLNQIRHLETIELKNKWIWDGLKVLELIIFYEKKEYLLLPYKVDNLYRSLLKRTTYADSFERLIISFFRKIIQPKNEPNVQSIFQQHKKKLFEYLSESDGNQSSAFRFYFDYIAWLDSNISNRPFSEMIRENSEHFERNLNLIVKGES